MKRVAVQPPWEAAVLPLSAFPVPKEELAPVLTFLQELTFSMSEGAACLETFVQFANLHLAGGAASLSANGREWMPMMGLGVWPDREPPTSWTQEELLDLGPEDKVRQLMHIVLRITGSREARFHARDELLGSGAVLQFISPLDSARFLSEAKDLLFPPIEDPSFKGFSLYVPLLEARSVAHVSAEQLDQWLCGADTLIRESPEDEGIFLLSKRLKLCLEKTDREIRWD